MKIARVLGYIALGVLLLGTYLVLLLMTSLVLTVIASHLPHTLQHSTGIDTQQSANYDFVSGVGPMVVALLGYTGLLAGLYHHVNCHREGCWRIARFPVGDGQFKVCRKDHPDPAVREGVQAHHLLSAHRAHNLKT